MFRKVLNLILIAVAIVLTMAILVALITNFRGIVVLLLPTLLLAVMGVLCAIASLAGATGRRVWTLLNTLEQTVRLNLPLPRMLRAMAQSVDPARGRMIQAAEAMERGAPLAVALEVVPQIPLRIVRLVAAAERAGRLPQVLGRIVQQHQAALARHNPSRMFYRVYPMLLGLVYLMVGGMFMVFVLPKFRDIFADFHLQLPAMTVAMLNTAYSGGPLLIVLGFVLFAALIWTFASVGRWHLVSGFIEGTGGWIANRLPWIRTVRMHQALGDVLDFAADDIESGRPIDLSLSDAAQITANSALRKRIQRWIDEMSRGQSVVDAARIAGMPSLVCGMLSTGLRTPDVASVFRFLGKYYSTRFSRAMAVLEAAVVPALAIGMGGLVLWFMLSVLLPLSKLIDSASPFPIGL